MSPIGVNYTFKDVDDLPENLEEHVVYVCDADKRALLLCPCGCKDEIHLNLADGRPSWKVSGNSIKPSIQKLLGCNSHFTITNGVTE